MKQLLTLVTLAGLLAFASNAHASLPGDTIRLNPRQDILTSVNLDTVDMVAQCYYGGGYDYGYVPVRRNYYRGGSGVSIRIGGGGYGRYGYPVYRNYGGYRGIPTRVGYGPRVYGPRYGGSGIGLFLNF